MPIIKSAIKRVKQAAKRNALNVATKKELKAAVKAFLTKPSAKGLSEVQSALDKAVKKNVLEKNTAARRKAQFSKVAKDAGIKLEVGKKASSAQTTSKKASADKTKAAPAKKTAAQSPTAKTATTKKPATKKPATKVAKKTA